VSSDIAARFGANVARCRKRAGISQEDLSVRASLHRTEVSQLERGLRLCRIDTLLKLTGSLEVTASELLAGLEWKPGGLVYGRFHSVDEAESR
jgi:transcriptional regulator with XRE-family HTH domain